MTTGGFDLASVCQTGTARASTATPSMARTRALRVRFIPGRIIREGAPNCPIPPRTGARALWSGRECGAMLRLHRTGGSVEQLGDGFFIGDAPYRLADERGATDGADLPAASDSAVGVDAVGDHQLLQHRAIHPFDGRSREDSVGDVG